MGYKSRQHRRGRSLPRLPLFLIAAVVTIVAAWWFRGAAHRNAEPRTLLALRPSPQLEGKPNSAPSSPAGSATSGSSETVSPSVILAPTSPPPSVDVLLASGRAAAQRGELVTARENLTRAFQQSTDAAETARLRDELARIAEETVFSARVMDGDPLVERYVLQPGDTLGKIARTNKLAVDLLAQLNGIADLDRIREGQTIKIVKGPFRAVVDKSDYALDVYLGETFVKRFPVALGADDSTPAGEWRVSTKLKNPTYYPPRGGAIIAADDPQNPLGERWIGLNGLSGEAVNQQRYGIHGTIEPDSIGKSVSMGCIRLRNQDVEALYNYLVEFHSTVTVQP